MVCVHTFQILLVAVISTELSLDNLFSAMKGNSCKTKKKKKRKKYSICPWSIVKCEKQVAAYWV